MIRRLLRGLWRRLGALLLMTGAYLLGSVPFSYLVVRRRTGLDVREVGSGNPGATNVLRVAGPAAGATALVCDVGKGVAAVVVPRWLGQPPEVAAGSAVAAVSGHIFPAYQRFRGGKGVATAFGALAALTPRAAVGSVLVFAGTVAATRYVSLGSMAGAAAFPVLMAADARRRGRAEPAIFAAAGTVAALVIARHHGNVRRLTLGTERRLGGRRWLTADRDGGGARKGRGAPPRGGTGEGTTDGNRGREVEA